MRFHFTGIHDLLPQDLAADDEARTQILLLSVRLSRQWWLPVFLQEDYRLLIDMARLYDGYRENRPLEHWRPRSHTIRKAWRDWDWKGGHAWDTIRTQVIEKHRRRLWAAAITYDRLFLRRSERLRWLLATVLTTASVTVAILVALSKAGVV